jgi:protein MpaA
LHTPKGCINYDGPAETLAKEMAKLNKYPVKSYIGYETAGSLGTYAGKELQIPTITLELKNESSQKLYTKNKESLLFIIRFRL